MPAGTILAIVIVCVLIAAAAGVAATLELRLMVTRRQFGKEYDRLAGKVGNRRARAELTGRKRRVARLSLRALDPRVRQELASSWTATQEAFVEDPPRAVTMASDLVLRAAGERGYPVSDREQLLADLSVHHGRRLDGYRRAEKTTAALASATVPTEDLRQALLWYRAMFRELAESSGPASAATPARPAGPARPTRPIRPLASARRKVRIPQLHTPRLHVPRLHAPRLHVPRPRRPRGQVPRPSWPRVPGLNRAHRQTPRPSQRQGANQT